MQGGIMLPPLKKCPVCGKLYDSARGCGAHTAPDGAHSKRTMSWSYPRKKKVAANDEHPFRKQPSTSTKPREVKATGLIMRKIGGEEILVPAKRVIAEARRKETGWQ